MSLTRRHAHEYENDQREGAQRAVLLATRLEAWFSGGVRASLERAGGTLGGDGATHRLTSVWARDDVVFAELDGRIVLGIAGAGRLKISEERFEILDLTDGRLDWLDEREGHVNRGEEFAHGPVAFQRGPVDSRGLLQVESPGALEADGPESDGLVH